MYTWGFHKNIRPHWAVEAYMPSGQRRGRQGSGISKGKQTIYRQMRMSKHVINKFLLGHPETAGHKGKFNK